ncbi:hypothetical protein CDAR_6241 [Caerostris darwini]|uniref:Uncharacterized protein n=1 Tax=Caerostris darwini TaxID=1538125 RepID=A0AAV4MX59_9ARAC|nr:hypothetical protein CDAR_6241 [Caerostris darwini]
MTVEQQTKPNQILLSTAIVLPFAYHRLAGTVSSPPLLNKHDFSGTSSLRVLFVPNKILIFPECRESTERGGRRRGDRLFRMLSENKQYISRSTRDTMLAVMSFLRHFGFSCSAIKLRPGGLHTLRHVDGQTVFDDAKILIDESFPRRSIGHHG